METAAFDAVAYTEGNKDAKIETPIKQEEIDKDDSIDEVKREPAQEEGADGEELTGRSMRKRKLNSMAEASDLSDESVDENLSKPQPKKRSQGGGASVGRPRGRPRKSTGDLPTNQADPSRNPRIVLKNIASVSQEDLESSGGNIRVNLDSPKSARGRRTGRNSTPRITPKPGAKGKNKSVKAPTHDDDEEEEEEEIEDDEEAEIDEDGGDDDDDDEDFIPKKKKMGRPSKQTVRSRGRGKGKGSKSKQEAENDEDEGDEDDEDAAVADGTADSTETNPNTVKTGQYLIEKSDMRRLENYPIWRMEGPNMLRKFEMIVQDGTVRHKSLYAYSSWAQSMADLYEKIMVRQISSQDGETIVEICPEYQPKPLDLTSLESRYSEDELLHLYNIYVGALLRQAVDTNFLKKIKMDSDSHYVSAINQLDLVIRDKISSIESEVSMKEDFKTRVRNCPNMKSIRRQNWSQTDQATTNKSTEKGVRSVLMFGYGYDPFLMEEDKSKGVEVAQEVVIGSTMEHYLAAYHGLIHFKFSLLKRCQDKVKLESAREPKTDFVLDKCLQDRAWILQTFDDLKKLLANETLS